MDRKLKYRKQPHAKEQARAMNDRGRASKQPLTRRANHRQNSNIAQSAAS
jgi:hypothetical protein